MSDVREPKAIDRQSLIYEYWAQFRKNRTAMVGLGLIVFFIVVAIFAPLIATHDPIEQNIEQRLARPFTNGYILGSDDLGRDLFSRIIYGTRISLLIGTFAVSISVFFGVPLGLIAGYHGGVRDTLIMRLIDILLAFPYILLCIVIVSILGPSLRNAMLAVGIVGIPRFSRLVRSSVLAEKESDYVMAERSLGASDFQLMFNTILPNCLAPVIVQVTLNYASAIISSAALSFLGMGTRPPTPEWGLMLSSAKQYVATAWWVVTFPGLAILITVLGFNLLGDGLRDVLDPRLKE